MLETKNALITGSSLGYEDHGVLTSMIFLDYGGTCQGFGGYVLDRYDKEIDDRKGTAYGMEYVRLLLKTVGVNRYEDLKGKYIRVKAEQSKVHSIGNIIEDRWFNPEIDLKSFIERKEKL